MPLRSRVAPVVAILLLWLGWNVVEATRVDMLAARDPAAALRLDPVHPRAVLVAAREAMAASRWDEATELAQRLLRTGPGQGQAFGIIALAAAEQRRDSAGALLAVASARARRDRDVRAAAAAAAFRAGDLDRGMAELDALLRIGARSGSDIFAAMSRQAVDPRFAKALVATLAQDPPPRWRNHFLAALDAKGAPRAVDQVHAGLQRQGDLSIEETRRWLDRMQRDGRWGDAYAQWIGTLGDLSQGIQAVHNGDFEMPITDVGFDWRRVRAQGVFTEVVEDPAAQGRVAHFHFIGRPVANGDLAHPLLLGPGTYRLSLRARGEYLRSESGLAWTVRCAAPKQPEIGRLVLTDGSFGWREFSANVVVPESGCPGQWLRLENPAVRGLAQQVSGDLWVDQVRITRGEE